MSIKKRSIIKSWFYTGSKPFTSMFHDWIDSFYHKTEDAPYVALKRYSKFVTYSAGMTCVYGTDIWIANAQTRGEWDSAVWDILGSGGGSGTSGYSGYSGYSGISGYSGYSGYVGISGYSGTNGSDILDLTKMQFDSLVLSGNLEGGRMYLITDLEFTYKIGGTSEDAVYAEPLIVTAINGTDIKPISYSPAYPQDLVYYDYSNGKITRRVDTVLNNDIGYDFRNKLSRRDVGGIPTDLLMFENYGAGSPMMVYDNRIGLCENNVFFGGVFIYNEIGNNFDGNTINVDFRNNTVMPNIGGVAFDQAQLSESYDCTILKKNSGNVIITYYDIYDSKVIIGIGSDYVDDYFDDDYAV